MDASRFLQRGIVESLVKLRANVVGPIALALFGSVFLVVGVLIAQTGVAEARELAESSEVSRLLGIVFACVGGVVVLVAAAWFVIARRIVRRRRAIR